jgi:hypothetical protein
MLVPFLHSAFARGAFQITFWSRAQGEGRSLPSAAFTGRSASEREAGMDDPTHPA